jgi:dTDP-4-dehydrorhamnose reductase
VKVLITGSGGQVGRALTTHAPSDAEIMACSHTDLDIGDSAAVLAAVGRHAPDVIINAAAHTAVDRAESEQELAARINTEGARNLALAARERGVRLLHISTDFVFDGTQSTPYRPDAPTNPLSVYGRTKRAGEEAVLALLPERSVVLRTAWVYAAQGHNFVHTMLRLLAEKGAVRVVADQVGTPTAAGSIAQVLWKIAAASGLTGIHHFTDAGVASWYDFAVAIAEEAGRIGLLSGNLSVTPITTAEYSTPARRPHYSVLDRSSLAELGIAPVHWRTRLRGVLGEIWNG